MRHRHSLLLSSKEAARSHSLRCAKVTLSAAPNSSWNIYAEDDFTRRVFFIEVLISTTAGSDGRRDVCPPPDLQTREVRTLVSLRPREIHVPIDLFDDARAVWKGPQ